MDEHHNLVIISAPPGTALTSRDVIEGNVPYREWYNESGVFIGRHSPYENYTGWTYLDPDYTTFPGAPFLMPPTMSVSIIPVEDGNLKFGWRSQINSKDPVAAHIARSWQKLDLDNPGSVDEMLARGDRELAADRARMAAIIDNVDYQLNIMSAPLIGVASFFGPGEVLSGVGIVRGLFSRFAGRGVAAESGSAKFISQGFRPAQAEYLAKPYPSTGMGHHSFITQAMGRKYDLPKWLVDSPLNVLKPKGISRGDFYELHYKVDPNFFNANFPKAIGGSWRGSSLGLEKYTGIGRIWHASPAPLKVTVGGSAVAGGGGVYYYYGDNK